MTQTIFPLTVRRADTLEMFEDHLRFSLLDPPMRAKLLYAFLFTIGAVVAMERMPVKADFFILFYGSIIGVGASLIQILTAYWEKQKSKRKINQWIDSFIHLKSHELVVDTHGIVYQREDGKFIYSFEYMNQLVVHKSFYHLGMNKEESLSIPIKAFEPGDAERFFALAKKMLSNYLAQKTPVSETEEINPSAEETEAK